MAITISLYNHTAAKFANGEFAEGDTYKLELLNSSASFTAADTQKTTVDNAGAYEVDGNGWTTGGETLANVAVTTVTTNDAMFDADSVVVTASGGDIGPANAALLYNDTDANDPPVAYIDFDGAQTAGNGAEFQVNWHTSGIFTWTVT